MGSCENTYITTDLKVRGYSSPRLCRRIGFKGGIRWRGFLDGLEGLEKLEELEKLEKLEELEELEELEDKKIPGGGPGILV